MSDNVELNLFECGLSASHFEGSEQIESLDLCEIELFVQTEIQMKT